jgi:hypothetical protein
VAAWSSSPARHRRKEAAKEAATPNARPRTRARAGAAPAWRAGSAIGPAPWQEGPAWGMDGPVSSPVAARRLALIAAARAEPHGFLRFEPGRLRFSLGTSLADLAVPVELAPDARTIVRSAATEVALLLCTHHKRLVPPDELDRLLLREEYDGLPPSLPTLGPGPGGPDLRGAAALGTACHPALPGGLMTAWLGKGGKGRSLVGLWIELTRRALEEAPAAHGEETPLIVALGLAAELLAAEAAVREALPPTNADRYLRAAAMTALWVAGRTGLLRAFRDAGRDAADPLLQKAEAVLSPAVLLGGRQAAAGGGATLYGCELLAGVPRADEVTARLAAGGDPEALQADLQAQLAADEPLAQRAEQAVAVARLREAVVTAVLLAEGQGQEARVAPLRDLLAAPGALVTGAADAAPRQALSRQLVAAMPAGEPGAQLDRVVRALRDWRPREPAAVFGVARERARDEYAHAALALCADLALERLAAGVRKAVSFRTGREAEGGADAEYEAGRLYRLSARPGPLLKQAVERPVAHLFADVKDFTRRTTLLGQAAMAELLRREFYLPIVVAAKEHFTGMRHLADRGGVQLNNLLGDAISFSGSIAAMLDLAQAIRRAFDAYAARLAREVSSEAVHRQLTAMASAHEAAVEAARQRRREAEAAARAEAGGAAAATAQGRLARAAAEEARLVEERDRALARARGEGLEAGVFISYGAAPLVVVIEDEVFGHNRVAIADKINESARGTARAWPARARADAQLAAERRARTAPTMQHAWSVFIGQPLALPVGQEAEEQAMRAARAGDLPAGLRALAATVREALEAAAREPAERPGDIYNSGTALSEEALEAYLAEVEGRFVVRRIELDPAEVPAPLRAFFWFGAEPQSLVICFGEDGKVRQLFRRVGRAAFKGLGGVTVWELCAEGGGPAALCAALASSWRSGTGR